MQLKKVKHSKIRNTGLLFEFLLRQITAEALNKKTHSKSVETVKKYFKENSELGKELSLYNILINKKFKSDKKANFFINEVLNQREKLNKSGLKREKYNLIKSLKENYDLGKFLSSKVPNYKIYASIYKLFEYSGVISPEEKTESHFYLVEYITTKNNQSKLVDTIHKGILPEDKDLRIIAYRTLLEKFNAKYKKLNYPQKSLLRNYINNISNTNSLKEYIEKVKPTIKKELKKYSKNLTDKVVKIKMNEAIKSIDKFCKTDKSNNVDDQSVIQTMRYMELLKEVKKSGKK